HLRVMLRAGIPLSRALESLGENVEQRAVAGALTALHEAVERGTPFAEGLAAHPELLPRLVVELVRAGEVAGGLEGALTEAAAYLRREHRLRSSVQNALLYPAIILTAMVVLGTGVVVFILPRLLDIFRGVTIQLPLPTRVLLAISDAIAAYGSVIGPLLVIAIVALVLGARSTLGRPIWHRIILRLGRLGSIAREVNVTRTARTLGGLLRTDLPIVRALELTASTLGNVHYQAALRDAATVVERGGTLRDALSNHRDLFPATALQLIGVGEQTGEIGTLLADLADFYETDLDQALKNLTVIIEPILMLVIGTAVGFLAVAVLQPMYSISQSI
ncbi:MAG: type II secretion system F family protein, partial [bacterium]|nr:type II secretion system F family protein [bacterium]